MPSQIRKNCRTSDLYLAKSFQDLKKKAEIENFGPKTIIRFIDMANKFYTKVQDDGLRKGDEEIAFMFCFRFMTVFNMVNNSERNSFLKALGPKCMEMIDLLESLEISLQSRYAEKQKEYENRKELAFSSSTNKNSNSSANPVPGSCVKITTDEADDSDNDEYRTIEPKELVDLIQSLSEISKILIIDTRATDQFNNSSIAANKMHATGEINLVNISHSNIVSGLTMSKLLKTIVSFGRTLDALERRRSMDRVVIMDDKTFEFDPQSKPVILANSFWKWDSSPDRIKSKPLLLKGGYYEFVLTYPTYTTKSDIINLAQLNQSPIDFKRNNNLSNKFLFNFDVNGEEIKPPVEAKLPSLPPSQLPPDSDPEDIEDDDDDVMETDELTMPTAIKTTTMNNGLLFKNNKAPTKLMNGFINNNNNGAFADLRSSTTPTPTIVNRYPMNSSTSSTSNSTLFNTSSLSSFSNNNNNKTGAGPLGSSKVPGVAMPVIPDRSSKPKINDPLTIDTDHDNNHTSSTTTIFDTTSFIAKRNKFENMQIDNENNSGRQVNGKPSSSSSISIPKPLTSISNQINNYNNKINTNSLLENLPPKPTHLVSSLSNNNSNKNRTMTNGVSNGNGGIGSDGEDKSMDVEDDFVAGNFDDANDMMTNGRSPSSSSNNNNNNIPNVPQTPVHHPKNGIFMLDEFLSENEDTNDHDDMNGNTNNNNNNQDDDDDDDENQIMITSVSKPISVKRPTISTSNYHDGMYGSRGFSGSSNLSRSLSSPNIAQFDQESQDTFHNNSVGSGTPKFGQHGIPMVDRTIKPLPYQTVLRNTRDFSPQFSSCSRIAGLRNLGNTCFMNSILQCLNNTTLLSEYLRSGDIHINAKSKFGSNGELTVELMELFKQMVYPSNYKHISPKDFKNAVSRHIPDFIDYKQQDAHEFLVRFLDRVHADLNQNSAISFPDPVIKDPNYYDQLSITVAANSFWNLHMKRNKSIISDLFEGLIVSTLTCLHCSYTSKALEAFTCLTVPISEGGRTSLKNSLQMFLRRERITDEAAWHCPTCRQKRDAEKCTYIWKLPKVLVIHFKRFSYDGMWRQKICTFVDFPIDNLVLDARDGEEHRSYNLYGVVNHSGSLEGGHYIAFSRNLELNIGWQRYDDQDVSAVSSASDVITQNAYVLFYRATN